MRGCRTGDKFAKESVLLDLSGAKLLVIRNQGGALRNWGSKPVKQLKTSYA